MRFQGVSCSHQETSNLFSEVWFQQKCSCWLICFRVMWFTSKLNALKLVKIFGNSKFLPLLLFVLQNVLVNDWKKPERSIIWYFVFCFIRRCSSPYLLWRSQYPVIRLDRLGFHRNTSWGSPGVCLRRRNHGNMFEISMELMMSTVHYHGNSQTCLPAGH